MRRDLATEESELNRLTSDELRLVGEPWTEDEYRAYESALRTYRETSTEFVPLFGLRVRTHFWKFLISLTNSQATESAQNFAKKYSGLHLGYRFYHLYSIFLHHKPKLIYEFGSGVSTVFMANLLQASEADSGVPGKIISFEQSEEWYEKLVRTFPAELKQYVNLNLVPVRYERFGSYRGNYFDFADYHKEIDFVYVDAPTRPKGAPTPKGDIHDDHQWFCIMADLIRLDQFGSKVSLAITDKRFINYMAYREHLSGEYDVVLNPYWRSIIVKKRFG